MVQKERVIRRLRHQNREQRAESRPGTADGQTAKRAASPAEQTTDNRLGERGFEGGVGGWRRGIGVVGVECRLALEARDAPLHAGSHGERA